jgi:hypothetical protein
MSSIAYPSYSERQVYIERAHRLRGAAVASLAREIVRLVSVAARAARASGEAVSGRPLVAGSARPHLR